MSDTATKEVLAQAITKAIEYETRVRDVYRHAVEESTDLVGKKVFQVLADEEQDHVNYLQHQLQSLQSKGTVSQGDLTTALPTKEAIAAGVKQLKRSLAGGPGRGEAELLRQALVVEQETSAFYREMVAKLPPEGRALFQPFIVIEDGHVAIVQAELDSVTQLGFWFDYQEFNLEAAG